MRAYDLILKKREGEALTPSEIKFLIKGYTAGEIPDYQMSAWAMAVYFKGMNAKETACLTETMAESGDQIDLSQIEGKKVDKHSTGGVGDTTTLILVPLVAAAGLRVPKMSGRGLGHTGGTIDKLESIPGFKTSLSRDKFFKNVNTIGAAVVGQTGNLTPADKKLYALRDVTATVDSIPLIASSIMSKKIAGGAEGIVLDVKTGKGAFMSQLEDARLLARSMVEIGKQVDRDTIAVITDMEQPLGLAVGNSLEVREAIETLKGKGPEDLEELCLTLGANMLLTGNIVDNFEEGYKILKDKIDSGAALNKFAQIVEAQGGISDIIEDYELLPAAKHNIEVRARKSGYVHGIHSREIGLVAMTIGAGRESKGDIINPAVGIVLNKKQGDKVEKGDTLAIIHLNNLDWKDEAEKRVRESFTIKEKQPEKQRLIYEVID